MMHDDFRFKCFTINGGTFSVLVAMFLLLELGIFSCDVRPFNLAVSQASDHIGYLIKRNSHLTHRVTFAQRHRVRLLQRVKVDGDTIRNCDFISTSVTAADRST